MSSAIHETTQSLIIDMAQRARTACQTLAAADASLRREALAAMAAHIHAGRTSILDANARDMDAAKEAGLSDAMTDRLRLDDARLDSIVAAINQVANQPDPLGRVLDSWVNERNGLAFEKVSIPIGVIAMIYESRPNVTADAAALCIASGNAVILRGGSESAHSSRAICDALRAALLSVGAPEDAVQMVPSQDRALVGDMLGLAGHIDLVIPRGGKGLTERVARESRVPTLLHLDGNCHSYVHASADLAKAKAVIVNAKTRRTGICGAMESLLIDVAIAADALPMLHDALAEKGVNLKGDKRAQALAPSIETATEDDWGTEYLAPTASVKIVDGVADAIAHINRYGSHHTDAILAEDADAIAAFKAGVDSAIVMVNASSQFADGGEFGFGGEIGIATGRLHARGPVGAQHLTTFKYLVTGNGSTRP